MFFFTGVDSTTLEMSLSTAWRDRRALTEQLAGAEIDAFFAQVQESGDRILVQFDEKELLITKIHCRRRFCRRRHRRRFCQTLSVNADPLDLFDQPLLLDMLFLGTPQ